MNSVQQLGARSVMWDFVPLLSRKLMRVSNVAVSYFMYLSIAVSRAFQGGGWRQRGQFSPGSQFKGAPKFAK